MADRNLKHILVAYSNKDFDFANRIGTALKTEIGQTVKMYSTLSIDEERNVDQLIENSLVVLLVATDVAKVDELLCEFAKKVKFVNKESYLIYAGTKPTWVKEKWRIEDYMYRCFDNSTEMSEVYASLRDKVGEVRLLGDSVGQEINVLSCHAPNLDVYRIKDGKEEPLGIKFRLARGKHLLYMHFLRGTYKNYVLVKEVVVDNPVGSRTLMLRDDLLDSCYRVSKGNAKSKSEYWHKTQLKNRQGSKIYDFHFAQYNIIAILCAVAFVAIMANNFYTGDIWIYCLIILLVGIILTTVIYHIRFSSIRSIIDNNIECYDKEFSGLSRLYFRADNCCKEI